MGTPRERCILGREVELAQLIGSGANGRVYLAAPVNQSAVTNHFRYPSRFVVKVMQKDVCPPGYAATILKELNAIRSLKHPFIVSYVGAWVEAGSGEHSGSVCLAMTYCDGGDLHGLICDYRRKGEYVPEDMVMMIMLQVFSALSHSHAHHIIHRDIKPANLFLVRGETSGGGVAKALVGDYGLARPLERTVELARTRVGTPCYCSPEIVSGEGYTTKTDMFSAGVTFFELMTQQRPFWKNNFTERQSFHAILHSDPMPQLRCVAEGRYDRSLVRVVGSCLFKKEKERPTAYEVLTGFSTCLTRYVRAKGIPVCGGVAAMSPMRGEGNSPPRGISPISPVRRTPSRPHTPSRPRKGTPEKNVVQCAAPVVPAAAAEDAAPEPNGVAAEQLLHVLDRGLGDRAETENLKRLLGGDVEAVLLVRVLLLTRGNNRDALENGIFKVLLSLKPSIPMEQVILWVSLRGCSA
ncbi:protein kinase [Trypanosoma rangeli SC58]|uniref:Protein kinase n=1 Tax=Trypanosoma rangeli SC58 TaxID=429131 RepID=A0A061JDC2_TRYRA|nr:protein kinase [Trypanosoma rangeli SC58]